MKKSHPEVALEVKILLTRLLFARPEKAAILICVVMYLPFMTNYFMINGLIFQFHHTYK